MTGNKHLLDTNIISAWLADDVLVASKIESSSKMFIPVIALGEMYYGAHYSTKVLENISNITKAISHYQLLYITADTCKNYGIIKSLLRKKGRPIPENDIWIASIAVENDLMLITRDKHFSEIEGLFFEAW